MKKSKAEECGKILVAYGKGERIQRTEKGNDSWVDIKGVGEFNDEYIFDFVTYDYRVIPSFPKTLIAKSEYRPYRTDEVLKALDYHGWKVIYNNAVYVVRSCDSYGKIWIGDKWHKNPTQGFNELTWYDDNTPYGAIESTL